MTDSFVTQCPHCQTRFRVSYNQLGVARGAVRCGACKQVFNAARQLLEQSATQQAQAERPTPLPQAQTAAPEPPAAVPTPAATPSQPTHEGQWDAAQLETLNLDAELARLERRPAPRQGTGRDGLSASRDAQDEHWPQQPFGNHRDEALPTETASAGEPPLLDDDAATLGGTPPALTGKHERTEPNLRDEHLLDLEDDPLQLQWQRSRSSFGKRLLWGLLSLLAALGLLGQYSYYHFDELARQDQYRPWFQALCPVVGCKVPSKVDVRQIKSSNLVVRSHPDFAGALVVDAIIYNRAPFSQPFPLLELRFADLNGQLIARRRFKPAEYLAGDLAGQAEMPPQTPIHIALDILDPGPKAVNYSLSFRSPE
ncbi:DUF3426 domain-containing protein [Pseudomonas typographi]|uniref:DUF3426 domain-containing protein n=1 Tax=Pseudomonas typographi TaxID=2715964 RepID=A0ABR7Z7W4_9PSED|nr:DUF3426 domain-containing protein [Pseudomonas typographi]MBD1554340.1 DUF3426 domain-containing protein [Pseudomonas typographi]MBD1589404.1 DUF3426 domain-containing protein [Pseudomonas typographi]MBD1601517.1 DUF3426 domain-containing protein [Pseudomonas typographi]